MKTYLYIDKLGSTLKKIMIEQEEKQLNQQYIVWFKQEFLLNITKTGFEKKLCFLLRISENKNEGIDFEDLPQFKDKYRDFKEISKFFSASQPEIYHIKLNHFVIAHRKSKILAAYHLYIDENANTNLILIGKFSLCSKIFVDSYKDLFYLIKENQEQFEISIFFINDHLKQVQIMMKSKFIQNIPIINSINSITKYNQNILLIFMQRQLNIIYLNSLTIQIIPTLNKKKLYFYPQFQFPEQVQMMIETENRELILIQNKIEQKRQLKINFKINLQQILKLNEELISKIFLLDLIQELPNVQEFCLWKSNDFEVVKLLIIGLQSTEEATAAIIYSLKYNPVHAVGIIKFLDYYCFLIEQDFNQLISAIFELIPGYIINNHSYEIQHFPKYINYLMQYKVAYSNTISDSKLVWDLLCNLTDNQFLKF